MTKIATGYVALKAETKGLKRDMDRAQRQLEHTTNRMQRQANRTASHFRKMWKAYAAGAAAILRTDTYAALFSVLPAKHAFYLGSLGSRGANACSTPHLGIS